MIDNLHFHYEERLISLDDIVQWYIDKMIEQNPEYEYQYHTYWEETHQRINSKYEKTFVKVEFKHDSEV